jgi:hypothetical protein
MGLAMSSPPLLLNRRFTAQNFPAMPVKQARRFQKNAGLQLTLETGSELLYFS